MPWKRRAADTWLTDTIAEHGHAVREVFPCGGETRAPFAYTIGLTALGHPELVIEGMPPGVAPVFLNDLADRVHGGAVLIGGTVLTDVVDGPAPFPLVEVVDTSGLVAVEHLYGRVDALQVIIPDSTSRLPWHSGYRNPPDQQRLRGRLTPAHLSAAAPTEPEAAQPPASGTWALPQLSQDDVVLVGADVLSGARVTTVWHHASGPWSFTTDDQDAGHPGSPLLGISSALVEQLDHTLGGLAALPAGAGATRGGAGEWVQWPVGSA